MGRSALRIPWVAVGLALLAGCPDDDGGFRLADHPVTFYSTMRSLDVEVAYEAGAEPYVGPGSDGRPLWSFLRDNLEALFEGRGVLFRVPEALEEMTPFAAQARPAWTAGQIRDLALALRSRAGTATEGRFIAVFLDGHFDGGDGAVEDILGVHVQGTPAVAVFKPAIRAHGAAVPLLASSLEQSTLVHEIGHVLGLVDLGLPMAAPHADPAHGGHCSNPDCVMYWEISAGPTARSFVRRRVLASAGNVVYGAECREDARIWHPHPPFGP